MSERDIESVLHEKRLIKPPSAFRRQALMKSEEEYLKLYRQSIQSPATFWKKAARDLEWMQPFKAVCEWKAPFAKWFVGGKLNASANCLDRHVNSHRRHKAAIIWEGEPGDRETWTYFQLYQEVCRFANGLQSLGIRKGDRVAIYMPMVPQAVVAMLGCARIGATHSVVFGGFSAESLKERINDCEAKCVITADGGWRRGKVLELKSAVDEAVKGCRSVQKVIVVQRTRNKVRMGKKDIWYHDLVKEASPECPPAALDSEHPLFVLYTSGSTGKPKGILHTTAGYLLGCQLSTRYVFDLKEDDLYWCTADIGWITGHSYVVYGVLANGGTSLIYEGAPNYPEPDRFWKLIEEHRVSIFYTAPTAIRAFMKWGDDWVDRHDLSSLRLLGTVGEPINPEAWMWYFNKIGGKRCPVVDTWWQTETGSHMVTTLPGVHSMRPGSAGVPFFGVDLAVVDETGKEVPPNTGGKLIIRRPWPSMLRTIFGDASRYQKQYWSEFKGCYLTGDGARKDKKGYFWIVGRIDDVLNVSGHRLGTAEVESALVSHPKVAEAAVVGRPDEIKGQGIVAFVSLSQGARKTKGLRDELLQHVAKEIGAIARPDSIRFADALPKTRSGKIMRRLLRNIAAGTDITGDTSTLEDPGVIQSLQEEV